MSKNRTPIASIHAHFNILSEKDPVNDGPVTDEEKIKALERFVRWHERQAAVGKELIARFKKPITEQPATE
jgi:hypothetical protein